MALKIAHWTLKNGSGMGNVAIDLAVAETALGLNSVCIDNNVKAEWAGGMDADVHVAHSHVPDEARAGGGKMVWIGHGTPEHCFMSAVEDGLNNTHGFSDVWMLVQYWLKNADAMVTFWPRHQAIWQSMVDKGRKVHCVPMGINDFWKSVPTGGKFAGTPSLLNAENCHFIKWPLDLVLMWPWVVEQVPGAVMHLFNLPNDQHRWWFPLMNRNGTAFKSHITTGKHSRETLRNAFVSTDFYFNTVRYGDYNRVGLEAKAAGCKLISYVGNQYADFWIPEMDQRYQAGKLSEILRGDVAPREADPVPTIQEQAEGMKEVYESLF